MVDTNRGIGVVGRYLPEIFSFAENQTKSGHTPEYLRNMYGKQTKKYFPAMNSALIIPVDP